MHHNPGYLDTDWDMFISLQYMYERGSQRLLVLHGKADSAACDDCACGLKCRHPNISGCIVVGTRVKNSSQSTDNLIPVILGSPNDVV